MLFVEVKSMENTSLSVSTSKPNSKWKIILANKYIYLMIIPVILYYLIFCYVPMYGVLIAFKRFPGGTLYDFLVGGNWEGLKYFKDIFQEPLFYRAVGNTLILSLLKLAILFPGTLLLSLMLNEIGSRHFKKVVQTIVYLPHFFSWVIIGAIVIQFLSPQGGVVSSIIQMFNGDNQVSLLTNSDYFRPILIVSNGFKELGWGTIIYLAAFASVPQEMYEAADIDGATRIQKIIYITLPSISSTIVVLLLINISFALSGDFEQVLMLYNSSVYATGDIIDTYIYRTGLADAKFSFATAVGLFKSVVASVLLISSNYTCKKLFNQSLY